MRCSTARRRARLEQQAPDEAFVARDLRPEQLERDERAGLCVRRAEHLAHAALAEDRLDPVWPDGVAHPSHAVEDNRAELDRWSGTLDSRVVRRSRQPWIGMLVATCALAPIPVARAVTDQAPTQLPPPVAGQTSMPRSSPARSASRRRARARSSS